MGSYLVVLKMDGYRDTNFPVFISRNKEWTGQVRLFTDDQIGGGFVHVPAGPYIRGGDPERDDARRGELEVDDFFIAEHPVTMAEYLKFLHKLTSSHGIEGRSRSLATGS